MPNTCQTSKQLIINHLDKTTKYQSVQKLDSCVHFLDTFTAMTKIDVFGNGSVI